MPRVAIKDNERLALRIKPGDKAMLMRAVALQQTDMTDFVLKSALREARLVIQEAEVVKLGTRDSKRVMELLENPPKANAKLKKAALELPEIQ